MKKTTFAFLILVISIVFVQTVFAERYPVVVEAEVRALIPAEWGGVFTGLDVDTGDSVAKGDLLGVVYHEDLILKKEKLEATQEYLEIQVENLTKLNAKGLTTDEELAKAKMEFKVNQKEIRIIETQIKSSEIRAPFSGTVIERHIQPHEWIKPGQAVLELLDHRKLRIVGDIPADIAVRMKKGQKHMLHFEDLKTDIRAKIKDTSPQVDVRSNTIKVIWRVDKKGKGVKLLPGMKGVLKLGSD